MSDAVWLPPRGAWTRAVLVPATETRLARRRRIQPMLAGTADGHLAVPTGGEDLAPDVRVVPLGVDDVVLRRVRPKVRLQLQADAPNLLQLRHADEPCALARRALERLIVVEA